MQRSNNVIPPVYHSDALLQNKGGSTMEESGGVGNGDGSGGGGGDEDEDEAEDEDEGEGEAKEEI